MAASVYNESKVPRFTAGVNSCCENEFLHHNHAPRFMGRVDCHADGSASITEIEWIDPCPTNPAEVAKLMREAGDWWAEEERHLSRIRQCLLSGYFTSIQGQIKPFTVKPNRTRIWGAGKGNRTHARSLFHENGGN